MPDSKRKRGKLTEEDVGARIFPYDHEAIIYEHEEDEGDGGEELERQRRRREDERVNPSNERPPR